MELTKKEAKAILRCKARIESDLEVCLRQLSERNREYAMAYWAAHIKGACSNSYGGMPVEAATRIASDDRPRKLPYMVGGDA